MNDSKLSEARIKANKKWDEKNKERKRFIVKRSTARSFIRNDATLSDLDELTELIDQRRSEIESTQKSQPHN